MALLRFAVPSWVFTVAVFSCGGSSPAPVELGTPPRAGSVAQAEPRGGGTVACGALACSTPREVCCLGDAPKCVPAPAADPEPLRYLSAVAEACKPGAPETFDGYAGCDDSGDCPGGTRCCEQFVASGAGTYAACSASCDIHEVCVAGEPCAVRGGACVGGICAMPPEKRRCGKAKCTAERPVCCGEDPSSATCATAEACDGKRRFECASSRDCVEGVCQRNVTGDSYCTLLVDVANAAVVCERDADCTVDVCMGNPGKMRCDTEEAYCVCEAP